jgi:SAM-dependent methyltransferase
MNRNKLKAYAPRARRDYIKAVTDRAAVYGLTKKGIEPVTLQGDVGLIGGKPFPRDVVEKRKRLVERIGREGFEQVMEAVAYTWFNRFAAIRFMEVHGYLDHGYRIFTTTNYTNRTNKGGEGGWGLPEIVGYAEHVELAGVDRERVVELKLAGNRDEELYRMLLVGQCNALHRAMPFLFERIGDATELLLPENLLHSDSLIRRMVNEVPEEEWEAVEIIGWLYQFYISEKKDQVIGKVVKSEDIPAATQLFTPNWIVKYMDQNTLGRLWMATYPHSPLKKLMEYYIEPAQQTPEVEAQLRAITPDSLNPEELTLADVACGSGHILVEGYDLFKAIYQERGYRAKDIPRLILEKNLYGLDIDDRAAQLAAFALMMKARADDRRIFERGIKLNVMAIQNSPKLDDAALEVLTTNYTNSTNEGKDVSVGVGDLRGLLELFQQGKTFGSLIRVPEELGAKLLAIAHLVENVLAHGDMFGKESASLIMPIVKQARMLATKHSALATNPPYMGNKGMNSILKQFLQDEYPDVKSDLFAAFIVRNTELAQPRGQIGFMSPFVWMFISSYEKLRNFLIDAKTITSLVQLEYSGFDGATVPICTFTLENAYNLDFKGGYVRLSDFRGAENQASKTVEAIKNPNCYWFFRTSATDFKKIPASPIAYWLSNAFFSGYIRNSQ